MEKPVQAAPKPQKISRKLKLTKQTIAQLNEPSTGPHLCTRRATGCLAHTC